MFALLLKFATDQVKLPIIERLFTATPFGKSTYDISLRSGVNFVEIQSLIIISKNKICFIYGF